MSSTSDFYRNLKGFSNSAGVMNIENFSDVPEDWLIYLTDVRGSTKAIEEGRYKEVNLVGVAGISAVKNACRGKDIPFVFGGDGASFVVPSEFEMSVDQALTGTAQMAKNEFKFELRIAKVSISTIRQKGQTLKVGKFCVSADTSLAVFAGGGLTVAESLVKDPATASQFEVKSNSTENTADFSGLECRWQPLPSMKGEIISCLVRAKASSIPQEQTIYQELMEELDLILGADRNTSSPVSASSLHVEKNPFRLALEAKAKNSKQFSPNFSFAAFKTVINLWINAFVGSIFMVLKIKAFGVDWARYKKEVIANSDFWKYDDMLRFVVDVTPAQKRALMACFNDRHSKGQIYFGVHSSKSALMTCLVGDRQGDHLHFIDGGDGGYAIAAKQLKEQYKKK